MKAGFAAALCLIASAVAAAPRSGPGGRFEERLKVAARRAGTAPKRTAAPVRSVPVRSVPVRSAPTRGASTRSASTRRGVRTAVRRTPTYRRSPRRSYVSAYAYGTRTRTAYRSRPAHRYAAAGRYPQAVPARTAPPPGTFSYSVDPRNRSFSNVESTGDVILFGATGKDVRFTWEGQQRVTRHPLILKGYLPQMLKVNAQPAGGGGKTEAWIPIRANCITTVRFKLR